MTSPSQLYRAFPSDRLADLTALDEEKFWSKVEITATCWLWTGTISNFGYGLFFPVRDERGSKKAILAHRVGFWLVRMEEPAEGLDFDHLCRIRRCVNHSHLEPVTRSVNVLRGDSPKRTRAFHRGRTHCKNGHPWTPENVILFDSQGYTCRRCKACEQDRYRKGKLNAAK